MLLATVLLKLCKIPQSVLLVKSKFKSKEKGTDFIQFHIW